MNKKLITVLMIGTLAACSQGQSGATPQEEGAKPNTELRHEMKITHVDATQAAKAIAEQTDLTIIDVRTAGEFAAGHIDGAINIDVKSPDFATKIDQLDKTKDYLVHCRSGARSTRSLKYFKEKGFKHILHMDGGMIGWNKAGLPTVK